MIKGIAFDINGTLIDILTDETDWNVFRTTANFLSYSGVLVAPEMLRELYFELNKSQRHLSKEMFPEFDVGIIFRDIVRRFSKTPATPQKTAQTADAAARVFRAASRHKLELYPGVKEILDELKKHYKLAAVSDGQKLWAAPEMSSLGLDEYFPDLLVSGCVGYRKPDKRMFEWAVEKMALPAGEILFVGNDMYRDIYGAKEAGMPCVFFKSNQGDHRNHGAEADYIIYDFRELPRAIEFLNTQYR
ncbi:MAG: HAD family hydrolase [Lentisphaeria bacterium]|nr:HAD family hydrolase [Lentisphaeria bacterium]